MDSKEEERATVAKPVASRPTSSNFRSFTELLSGAINTSPPPPTNASSENTIAAIRPKTVRLKAAINPSQSSLASVSIQVSKPETRPTIYKPQAKVVSKTTASLLANMGNLNASPQVSLPAFEPPHQETPIANVQTVQNQDEDPKAAAFGVDRPSYDGYNWRKYGQKQVKGSDYPRSYYKCTHPNCPVKKKVERSLDGQIAEIVYKGEHNHSKPQPPKKNNSSAIQGQGVVSDDVDGQDTSNPVTEGNEGPEGREPIGNVGIATPDEACGVSGECEEGSKALEGDEEEPRSKRRKRDNQLNEVVPEPRPMVPSSSDANTDIVGDGFRWRKYGQKVVKGNPYPRSYYRCTGPKCNVRKYVERVSDDPGAFITTYEGKHNHEMPVRGSNSVPSDSNVKGPTTRRKT